MTLKELSQKEDLIFVGGFAMNMHRLKETYGDVDVVVTNLNGIVDYIEYKTDSAFSSTGKRAFINSNPKVDIFIENSLPEFELIDGYKVQTIKSMIEYYERIYPLVKEYWKPYIKNKLKILK